MRVELRAARLPLLSRSAFAAFARPANPDDRSGVADAKACGDLPGRHARQRGVDYAITQILAVGSRHAPPPSLSRHRIRMVREACESRPESEISEHALVYFFFCNPSATSFMPSTTFTNASSMSGQLATGFASFGRACRAPSGVCCQRHFRIRTGITTHSRLSFRFNAVSISIS